MVLRHTQFPMCCGIEILCDFQNYRGESNKATRKEVKYFLQLREKVLRNNKGNASSIMLASLNASQRKNLHSIFMDEEWEVLLDGAFHASHQSKITLYGKALYDSPKKKSIKGALFGALDFSPVEGDIEDR